MKKNGAGLAHVRTLCSTGLPAEQLIPALLEALHSVIPSARNLFDWTDAEGNLIRYYFEGPIDHAVARRYFEEFHNKREGEVMPRFRQAVTGRAVIRSAAELNHDAFFRSALYNEIWRPQRLHTRIEAIVRGLRGVPLGSLVLYREKADPPFRPADEKLLEAVVPYVARALEGETSLPRDFIARRDRRAVLSLSPAGKLLNLSQDAQKMLLLSHGGITPASAGREPLASDFSMLVMIVDQVNRNRETSRCQVGFTLDNAWGRFVFEAEPLMPVGGAGAAEIHVTIEHQEPRAMAWHRALGALPLSPAQREVCGLLRAGLTQRQVAAALSVAPTTVADHVRKIYGKLDVSSVQELIARVEELTRSTPPPAPR